MSSLQNTADGAVRVYPKFETLKFEVSSSIFFISVPIIRTHNCQPELHPYSVAALGLYLSSGTLP